MHVCTYGCMEEARVDDACTKICVSRPMLMRSALTVRQLHYVGLSKAAFHAYLASHTVQVPI